MAHEQIHLQNKLIKQKMHLQNKLKVLDLVIFGKRQLRNNDEYVTLDPISYRYFTYFANE